MLPDALLGIEHFVDVAADSYLYTGAHAPALGVVLDAMQAAYRQKSAGPTGRKYLFGAEERARESVGDLLGRPAADIAFTGDASTLWSSIAAGWPWKPGDNVVINEYEHPAGYAAWLRLRAQGLEVRIVRRQRNWSMPISSFEDACDSRTVALITSHVGYVTGLALDVHELAELADSRGIPLLLDASHSLGVLPIATEKCSVVISASYKWALGPYGIGIIAWNRDRLPDFRPGVGGWRSVSSIFEEDRFENWKLHKDARRFQTGAPAFDAIAGLGAAVDLLRTLGADRVQAHATGLSGQAHDALSALGLEVISSKEPKARSGNVAFLHPRGEDFANALEKRGVFVWGGDGRVRASFHVMNDSSDVERLAAAVADALIDLPVGVNL